MVIRARQILKNIVFCESKESPTPLIGPIPPWVNLSFFIKLDFISTPVKNLTDQVAQKIFKAIREENYQNYREIYTDGSKIDYPDGEESVSAGLVIFHESGKFYKNWKLPSQLSIVSAEMYAIYQALNFVELKVTDKKTVIYTDSLSSLMILLNSKPSKYSPMCYKIQELLLRQNMKGKVILQYKPGHKEVEGNELADLTAKAAHNNSDICQIPIPREDAKAYIRKLLDIEWYNLWEYQMAITGKGLHLRQIKNSTSNWQWSSNRSRRVETAMARLRIGHVRLQKYWFRFNLIDEEMCDCGEDEESVEHFLLECNRHSNHRIKMICSLIYLDVQPTLQNILGGGNFALEVQRKIIRIVSQYLEDTGKLMQL